MHPDQPFPAPPSNNYDFIMNPAKPNKGKSGLGNVGNNKFLLMIGAIVGGTVLLMITVAVVLNLFFGSKTNLSDIVTLTQTQQEIIRLTNQSRFANDQIIKNAAMSTYVALESEKKEWLTFLAKYGEEVDDKRLALKKNLKTDALLTNAKQTSTFDSTYALTMRSQLESYGAALQDAYSRATNKTQRAMLSKHYDHVQLLLEQWPV